MTGGHDSPSREIFRDKKWTVLENGNLPSGSKIFGLGLTTVNNTVFAFGKVKHNHFLILTSYVNSRRLRIQYKVDYLLNLSFQH